MAEEMAKIVNGEDAGLKEEVTLPEGVTASLSGKVLTVKGPRGEASMVLTSLSVAVVVEGNRVALAAGKDSKKEKKLVGSLRAHIVNLVRGVTDGHSYKLKVCYTHFPITVTVAGNQFLVKNFLGEKIPRALTLPEGVNVKVEGSDVIIDSVNKEVAGRTAAAIEQLTRRANYDTRVFGDGIYITVKDGKEIK